MSEPETFAYTPSDIDIDTVIYQVPDSVTREDIINVLIDKKGDITDTILYFLTNNNVVEKSDSPKRTSIKAEIKEWNNFYKDFDKYNIQNNIERIKTPSTSTPLINN
jgi:hypothetical protein